MTADPCGATGEAELCYVEIELTDADGNVSFPAEDEVTVSVEGGELVGTGSGRIDDGHVYAEPACRAYHGRLLAAIRPLSDVVTVKAAACGKEASLTLGGAGK